MDKIYDTKKTNDIVKAHDCYAATIRKNNNKEKNREFGFLAFKNTDAL